MEIGTGRLDGALGSPSSISSTLPASCCPHGSANRSNHAPRRKSTCRFSSKTFLDPALNTALLRLRGSGPESREPAACDSLRWLPRHQPAIPQAQPSYRPEKCSGCPVAETAGRPDRPFSRASGRLSKPSLLVRKSSPQHGHANPAGAGLRSLLAPFRSTRAFPIGTVSEIFS